LTERQALFFPALFDPVPDAVHNRFYRNGFHGFFTIKLFYFI
jgi:hypothetical protein